MPQLKIQKQKQQNKDTPNMRRIVVDDNNKTALNVESKYQKTTFNENFEDFSFEREQNFNRAFNYESGALDVGCCISSVGAGAFESVNATLEQTPQHQSESDSIEIVNNNNNGPLPPSDKLNEACDLSKFDEHIYENLTYEKELLLHKYFRSRNAIYENLCRGCGYGVFESHGELCFFCASIVNGVRDTPNTPNTPNSTTVSITDLDSQTNTCNNIYENICEKCYLIYSTETCEHCDLKAVKKQSVKNLNKSNDELCSKPANGVKVTKSKSFNKRNEKRGLFQGFIGSLKRAPKSPQASSAPKLEIIHNVDGFDQVFRTQETFDLQRICELKQAQHSSSEQHIYGRLKCGGPPEANHSNSTQTLPLPKVEATKPTLIKADSESSYLNFQKSSNFVVNNCESTTATKSSSSSSAPSGKRPRISKPRLLRAITSATQKNNFNGKSTKTATTRAAVVVAPAPVPNADKTPLVKQQSLYLADSVCKWMTSLRREVHNYHNLGDDLCNPKSIPAKQNLIGGYNAGIAGANFERFIKIDKINFVTNTLTIDDVIGKFINKHKNSNNNSQRNSDVSSAESLESSSSAHDESAVTLRSKQALEQVFAFNEHTPVACAQMVNEFMRGLLVKQAAREMLRGMENELEESKHVLEALERRDLNAKRQAQRAKRQAIYLKNHEVNEMSNSSEMRDDEVQISRIAAAQKNNNNENSAAVVEHEKNIQTASNNYSTKQKLKNQNDSENIFEAGLANSTANSESSPVSRRRTVTACSGGDLNNKRCGIYDLKVEAEFVGDILSEFDTYLQREEAAIAVAEAKASKSDESIDTVQAEETQRAAYLETEKGSAFDPFTAAVVAPLSPTVAHEHQKHLINFIKLVEELHLSRSLHRIVLAYEQPLLAFLKAIHERYPSLYANWPKNRLNKKYKRFHKYCIEKKIPKLLPSTIKLMKFCDSPNKTTEQSSKIKKDFENVSKTMTASGDDDDALKVNRNSVKIIVQQFQIQQSDERAKEMVTTTATTINKQNQETNLKKLCATNETYMTSVDGIAPAGNDFNANLKQIPRKPHRVAPKKPEPPQVPQRDPKTALSAIKIQTKRIQTESQKQANEEESIYHPIWNFKTVGEVPERYKTDADYYEIDHDGNVRNENTKNVTTTTKDQKYKRLNTDTDSLASLAISTGNDIEEDHGEWETDDEFMFATEMLSTNQVTMQQCSHNAADALSLNSSQAPSMQSTSSLSGSTVAGFSSSTATLASAISASLTHQLLRNISIFYSLTEPKLRAIIYDYDRVHASKYFAKQLQAPPQEPSKAESPCSNASNESNANDSGIGKSPKAQRSPMPPPRTTSIAKGPSKLPPKKSSESGCQVEKLKTATATTAKPITTSNPHLVPDSVLAWKFMLLDVNYLEDEEDMIVSEAEILRAQQIKEDNDIRQTPQLNFSQRYKSASFGNLVDLPDEDEKIGIPSAIERMREKLQRGVFKINIRSPKSDKKNRGVYSRRAEATSLYLEDGMKPKYPIFGAPLEQLELDRTTYYNVPRFVVDAVAYIERKDCILQEGLYRASGNKVSIEELKQKLSESYIYDPKLIVTDDIHTLTSLLKLFFRELGAPLIPQDIYERLGRNLNDEAGIESIRDAFEDLPEPNRSTLKFLIKHLTNVAACSSENRMPASNLAIVWGPCILSANPIEFDIGRMNTLAKVLIENYARVFNESERLVA